VPLKKYAVTPYGYEALPAQWNVHPTFGTPAKSMTPEIARVIDLEARGGGTFASEHELALFSPDGNPLAWYCETPEDGIEVFRSPGVHSTKGIPLKPITSEVAKRLVSGSVQPAAVLAPKLEGLERLRNHLKRTYAATSRGSEGQ